LITEMLDVAGIGAGTLAMDSQPVRVAAAVREAMTLIAPQADARGMTVSGPASGDPSLAVAADPRRLRQVLLNLLGNAVKYGRPGGRIDIEVAARDGQVALAVRDDGPGLSEEAQGRLFRPFERIEQTARGVEGTGLGLALSKRLVEAMGGAIGVDTRPGEGARFWFRLPAATAAPLAEHPRQAPEPRQAGAHRLLLVEDNASNRALVATVLERNPGWQLVQTTCLAEARAELAVHAFDLILLDLHLPDGDGLELLQWRRDAGRPLPPVLVLSADATPQARERALRAGAAGMLTKPLDLRQFHAEIARCVQ
ncbi:MAG: response regulator, partial [Arenimonas sp.]|uniref:hybrid sensor histidine kinase/response regulator n=1 Tax=Arenimonas sp. TaxID=1872635 RepID=UPI0025C31B1F